MILFLGTFCCALHSLKAAAGPEDSCLLQTTPTGCFHLLHGLLKQLKEAASAAARFVFCALIYLSYKESGIQRVIPQMMSASTARRKGP